MRVKENHYQLPNNIPDNVQDVIIGLLCPDPNMRLTLENLMKHPWLLKGEIDTKYNKNNHIVEDD
jgi:serine/threonine protein kinase